MIRMNVISINKNNFLLTTKTLNATKPLVTWILRPVILKLDMLPGLTTTFTCWVRSKMLLGYYKCSYQIG